MKMQVLKGAVKLLGSAFVIGRLERAGNKIIDKSADSLAKKFDVSPRNYGGELKYADYNDLPKLDLPAGYCYIIRDGTDPKRHRLGIASHPCADIEKLRRETPYEIAVVALIVCANVAAFERDLSQRFDKKRERAGKWYKLNKSDLRAIDNQSAIVTDI